MKLFSQHCLNYLITSTLFLLVASSAVAVEENISGNSSDEKFIEQVLADAKQNQFNGLKLYSRSQQKPLTEVDASLKYKIVRTFGSRLVIKFLKPSVPIWVKQEFVQINAGIARITASALKLRSRPDINSYYIGVAERNYQSPVLASNNGFIQILAPNNIEYSIYEKELPGAKRSGSAISDTSSNRQSSGWVKVKEPSAKEPSAKEPLLISKKPTSRNNGLIEGQHILSPGDSISSVVFGEPDLSVEGVRVPSGGQISFPLIGSVSVAGRTTAQVEKEVATLLGAGYVKNPRVSVTIFSYRPIFVRGAVNNIGAFPYAEGLTVANAIALAGGAKNSALDSGVSIVREGVKIEEELSSESLVLIRSGDVINVAEDQGVPDEPAFYVYLHGEVVNPGEYAFRKDLTVEKAVVLAGGFTLRASRRKITITRYSNKADNEEPQKFKRVELYTSIEPGDIIDVGSSWF